MSSEMSADASADVLGNIYIRKSPIQMSGQFETKETQTPLPTDPIDNICEITNEFSCSDLSFFTSRLWAKLTKKDQIQMMFMFYNDLDLDQQSDLSSLLGSCLNSKIYADSKKLPDVKHLSVFDLETATKSELYNNCDRRLASFIDALTEKQQYARTGNNVNFLANIYENILKARDNNFVSKVGVKEHMVTYLASGKSRHASQIFSKQGGKGSRPVLENILKNSANSFKFEAPEKTTFFFI